MAKTIFGKIIAAVLDVFISNFPEFIHRLFNKIPDELREKIEVIIEVVGNINKFVQSPTADFLTAVIPGNVDDEFKEWLRANLPKVFTHLGTYDKFREQSGPELHSIASLLTKELTGTSFGQAAITAEVVYQKLKK